MMSVHWKSHNGKQLQTISSPVELLEDLRLLRQLAERQTSELVTLTAKLRLTLDLLEKHAHIEEFFRQIGEGGITS